MAHRVIELLLYFVVYMLTFFFLQNNMKEYSIHITSPRKLGGTCFWQFWLYGSFFFSKKKPQQNPDSHIECGVFMPVKANLQKGWLPIWKMAKLHVRCTKWCFENHLVEYSKSPRVQEIHRSKRKKERKKGHGTKDEIMHMYLFTQWFEILYTLLFFCQLV